jgi:CubicO group peptidase (beta-lactamase class C family)
MNGFVAAEFSEVRACLQDLVDSEEDCDGQFVGYIDGECVADLWAGDEVAPDDLQGVASCTKGISGICLALLVERGQLSLDERVRAYWPEFAASGKGGITVRQALSHQAGIPGVEPQLTLEELVNHELVTARIAEQAPHWRPGAAHGYHAATIGAIMDELVRRTDGRTMSRFFAEEIAEPRQIDFYIGVPAEARSRLVDLRPRRAYSAVAAARSSGTLAGMTFNADAGWRDGSVISNHEIMRTAGQSAMGGYASARGIARLYAMTISEIDGHPALLSPETLAVVTQIQGAGEDLILGGRRRYGIVFQLSDENHDYGSHQAFGHGGAGGAIGVADPRDGLAYGWIPRRMSTPGGADRRGMRIGHVLRDCADRLTKTT